MATHDRDPHEDKVRSVPLPGDEEDEDEDVVIAQENQSAEVAAGGGEWPSPKAPSTGPAPGAEPDREEAARPDEVEDTFAPIKETLAVDPLAGGARSTPPE